MNQKLDPAVPERCLRAFLDLTIVCMLAQKSLTAYEMNNHFVKRYGIMIAPSTIYSTLNRMKEKGFIDCLRKRGRRIYSATEQGQEAAKNMDATIEEIHRFTKLLLGS